MTVADKLTRAKTDIDEVFDKGIEQGKKAEHDHFWDIFQQNGERTHYESAFYGFRNSGNFYPKYDIAPTGSIAQMMMYFAINDSEPIDLAARLEECGVKLDTSKATSMNQAFYWRLGISRLPEISFVSAGSCVQSISQNPMLITIDKVIFSNDGTQPTNDTVLANNTALKNITIEGVIGKSINLGASQFLTAESLKSVIFHLKNYAGTDEEFKNKLTLNWDAWNVLAADSLPPTGTTWKEYIQSLGWNT